MLDVDDPVAGALVPAARAQLEEFKQPRGFVTTGDDTRVAVRRHRDALNHVRKRPTNGVVTWGPRMKARRRYSLLSAPDGPGGGDREAAVYVGALRVRAEELQEDLRVGRQ